MNALTKKVLKNERGVTLIELLAVIVILGIIAAIAIPAVMSNFDNAKKNADAQTSSIVKEAVQRLLLDDQSRSTKLVVFSGTPEEATINISVLVNNGYLAETPHWSNKQAITDVTIAKTSGGGITVTIAPTPTY